MRDDRFDAFERRHIGPRDADITDMLRVVGASSLEALVTRWCHPPSARTIR
jgi:glycine cleavage system pyridoxal-binding protein P